MRLLLVEDDSMIGESVLDLLRAEQYAVDWVRDGDAARLTATAHKLKGSALNLGLPRVGAAALALEERGRSGRLEGSKEDYDVLAHEVAAAVTALGRERAARTSG